MRDYKGDMELAVVEMCCAGGVAGFAQSFVRGPVERVKTVMQTTKNPDGSSYYRSTFSCIKDLLKTQGLSGGLFRGLSATIAREVSCVLACVLGVRDFVFGWKFGFWKERRGSEDLDVVSMGIAGEYCREAWVLVLFG